ncbi:MAG: hypothetical protein GAK34_00639 [Delftia tsuruhatensis]|nr:MAG: hypothetical protein GAK34_00639 [Delftia tsuruhatensis]
MRELGNRAGVNYTQISRYEMGTSLPRPGQMLRLAEVLGVSFDELAGGGTGQPPKPAPPAAQGDPSKRYEALKESAWNAAVTSMGISAHAYKTIRLALDACLVEDRARLEQSADMAFINVALMARQLRTMEDEAHSLEVIAQSIGAMVGTDSLFRVPLDGLPPHLAERFDPDLMPIPPHRTKGA